MGIYKNISILFVSKYIKRIEMAAIALGKYERVSAENYEEFLKALGVNFLLRKAATVSTPIMEAFEETTPDGRQVSALVTVDGNKFISEQTAKKDGEKSTKTVREFTEEGCTVTMEVLGSNVISVQKFKRV